MRGSLAIFLLLIGLASPAYAQGCGDQNPNCIVPTRSSGDSSNAAASTTFVGTAIGQAVPPNPIQNPPWTTPPNTLSGNFGVPTMSGNPTWSGTGHISGTTLTVDSTISGSLTAGMTLVGNKLLPGTVLVSGGPINWTITPSYGSITTEAMTAEGVYSCAGASCVSGVTNNKFVTGAGVARSIGTLSQAPDGQSIPGGLNSGDIPCCMIVPSFLMVAADTSGGGLPNYGLLNLANGQNAKTTFLVSQNGSGAFSIGYNADAFIGNNGVFPHYGILLQRDQELPTQFQSSVGGAFTAIAAYGRCTSNGTIPANNSTLNVGGTTVTFVTGAPGANQVQIGANMRVTLANLWTFLNASADVNISKAAWINDGEMTFTGSSKLIGSVANSYVLSTAGGSNFTCPGTFAGGGGNGLNVTGNTTFSQNTDLSTTQVNFANGVPVNFGTSGFASTGSGATAGFTNTGTFTSIGSGIITSGSGSGFVGNRRDNNNAAFDLFSASGEVGLFHTGFGANAWTVNAAGTNTAFAGTITSGINSGTGGSLTLNGATSGSGVLSALATGGTVQVSSGQSSAALPLYAADTASGSSVTVGIQNLASATSTSARFQLLTGLANTSTFFAVNQTGASAAQASILWSSAVTGGLLFSNNGTPVGVVSNGWQIGAPTGGDKGSGTINIQGTIWTNGTQGLASKSCVTAAATITITNGLITATSGC